jgi:hypothetical protein
MNLPFTKFALADVSITGGLGVAVQSNGAYSPLADVTLNAEKWRWATNISGTSESKTKVTHLLSGVLYQTALMSGKTLSGEIGFGALYAETVVKTTKEKMYNMAVPIGISWNIIDSKAFLLEANWRSWIFSIPSYIPPTALISHDRFTTLTLSAGVSI